VRFGRWVQDGIGLDPSDLVLSIEVDAPLQIKHGVGNITTGQEAVGVKSYFVTLGYGGRLGAAV
jgi:hypothetical protein